MRTPFSSRVAVVVSAVAFGLCSSTCLIAAPLDDHSFFDQAAKSWMNEIAISKGVRDRLTIPAVKEFAKSTESDHADELEALKTLAKRKAVLLPPRDKAYVDAMERWGKQTQNTDLEYINETIRNHEDAQTLFQQEAKSADPEIAAFAEKSLGEEQAHLIQARDLQTKLKGS